jgi:hypothetical protein
MREREMAEEVKRMGESSTWRGVGARATMVPVGGMVCRPTELTQIGARSWAASGDQRWQMESPCMHPTQRKGVLD